jgi:hypothetical protein
MRPDTVKPLRRRRRRLMIVALMVGLIISAGLIVPSYVVNPEGCILCQASRMNRSLVIVRGLPSISWHTDYVEGPFTVWFRVHRPPHEHLWEHGTWRVNKTVLRQWRSTLRMHPGLWVPQEALLKFVTTSDSQTIEDYFRDILSDDREVQYQASRRAGAPRNWAFSE